MPSYRVAEAAKLLGCSDDTVRRWIDSGQLASMPGPDGRLAIDGAVLARFASGRAGPRQVVPDVTAASARNRFRGLVTRVVRDAVMAQVELQCGPYRVVSLMSREAADEMGLEIGVTAVALVKSTNVVVEIHESRQVPSGGAAEKVSESDSTV